jgi:hypothetical protein
MSRLIARPYVSLAILAVTTVARLATFFALARPLALAVAAPWAVVVMARMVAPLADVLGLSSPVVLDLLRATSVVDQTTLRGIVKHRP